MHYASSCTLALVAVLALALAGCVELDGQRICWSYDAASDELRVLIHYDGVHDTGSGQQGREQLTEFLAGGDFMLLDWPLHVDMDGLRAAAANEKAEPVRRAAAELLLTLRVEPIGYYREPDGKMGAAQRVTIPNATQFIDKVNDLINDAAQSAKPAESGPLWRTKQRMLSAAQEGHRWIRLDGHALRIVLPVHRREWELAKGRWLKETSEYVLKALSPKANENEEQSFRIGMTLLASTPWSYIDRGDEVEYVIGRKTTTSAARVAIRDEYKPNLERTIKEGVKIDLDEQLASALLDAEAEPAAAIADLLRFGPPEDQVRALLAVIEGDDASRRTQAVERLGQWAEAWNGDQGVPEAPAGDAASDVAAWKTWYAAMKWYPIPYGESDSQQGEEAEDSAESDASAEPEESAPPEEGAVP